ncbi:hypothetical protein GCM10007176_03740 [Salinicoccus roseus]|uniref:hypothetical protein n=2 Tax=Salinicoccus roseus TaxID=45670 RepID=UPI000FC0DF7A|nr:capsular polysaccharide biosynthesis protein [Salinicoccus roseus]GGA62557.1 hypothetical protein GCM10007176_03740 [Salinicoccus roseus]
MYFMKRNLTTISIFTLLAGCIGTLAAAFMLPDTYDYEAFYTLRNEISDSTLEEMETGLTESMDIPPGYLAINRREEQVVLEVLGQRPETAATATSRFETIMEERVIIYTSGKVLESENDREQLRALIILISIIAGLFVGIVYAALNRRIMTDEDVKRYLGEKTLGRF